MTPDHDRMDPALRSALDQLLTTETLAQLLNAVRAKHPTLSEDEAEEWVQEQVRYFLEERLYQYDPNRGSLRKWLFLCVVYYHNRRAIPAHWDRRREELDAEPDQGATLPDPRPGPEAQVLRNAEAEDITRIFEDYLKRVPENQREALVAVWCDGKSYAETADRLGVRSNTIQQWVCRARQRIWEEYRSWGGC